MSATLAVQVGAIAAGTLAAQHFVDELQRDQAAPSEAIERVRQLQIEHGTESLAISSFLSELSKRAAR